MAYLIIITGRSCCVTPGAWLPLASGGSVSGWSDQECDQ